MKVSELKEIFDIFITKLDENKEIMDVNQKIFEATQHLAEEKNEILSAIDEKAKNISSYHPTVTYSVPALDKFTNEQMALLTDREERIKGCFNVFLTDLNLELKKIKNEKKNDEKAKLYLLIAFLILLLTSFCFLAYGLNQSNQKKEFEQQAKMYRRSADARAEFIDEKRLTEKYKKWLNER